MTFRGALLGLLSSFTNFDRTDPPLPPSHFPSPAWVVSELLAQEQHQREVGRGDRGGKGSGSAHAAAGGGGGTRRDVDADADADAGGGGRRRRVYVCGYHAHPSMKPVSV